tara:strand:+ start:248394 stop:248570 length:177 start_codon:yes stop_codon:yes gene_type:complete
MFGWLFTSKEKSLTKKRNLIMTQAVEAQRNGNLELYANLTHEANQVQKQIDELKEKEK